MKRIVIITSNLSNIFNGGASYGGGYVVTRNLIFELLKLPDIDLTILTEENSKIDLPLANVIEIPYTIYNKNFKNEVEKFLEQEKFDIVLSANTYYPFQNYMLQCHSYSHRAKNIFFLFRPVKQFLSRKKINIQKKIFKNYRNNKFIAMSEIIKSDYSTNFGIKKENISVIHPACKQIFETTPQIDRQDIVRFGIVANSSINKGGHYFLFALGIAKLLGLKFNLKMIAPKYKKDIFMQTIINMFNMKKNIEVLPVQEDMSYFYSGIDFLVLPSKNEAFGLVALEAMSYGKVSIVSSSTGVCDIITKDNGVIFNRKSFVDFIKVILQAAKIYKNNFEYYKILAANAYNTSKQYSWNSFALNIVDKL